MGNRNSATNGRRLRQRWAWVFQCKPWQAPGTQNVAVEHWNSKDELYSSRGKRETATTRSLIGRPQKLSWTLALQPCSSYYSLFASVVGREESRSGIENGNNKKLWWRWGRWWPRRFYGIDLYVWPVTTERLLQGRLEFLAGSCLREGDEGGCKETGSMVPPP